jgi:hypothetical protein
MITLGRYAIEEASQPAPSMGQASQPLPCRYDVAAPA